MATNIEWTDATWNPTTGCTRASAGCDNCYAFTMTKRLAAMGQAKYQGLAGKNHFNGVLKTWDDELQKPLHWRKPRMVFVNSMSDLFHKDVELRFIDKVFAVMAFCHQHTFQVLTKRPGLMAQYFKSRSQSSKYWESAGRELGFALRYESISLVPFPLPNVWLGTSCENEETADERIPHLLNCPAAVRFLSCEPLIGRIDLRLGIYEMPEGPRGTTLEGIDWVIVGGESGHGARPCNIEWIQWIVDQCKAASVPCFVKQLGKNAVVHDEEFGWMTTADIGLTDSKGGDISEFPEDLRVRQFPQVGARQEAAKTNP